jgi:transcriptional regulator with XRE-family HTH domain
MAKHTEPADWAARYAGLVADQVRHYRKARGMSAQNLSDACADLGLPIHRSVIANFENGRRANLDLGELFVIALALDVAPITLMLPGSVPMEVGGRSMNRADALAWIAGTPRAAAFEELDADLARARDAVARAQEAVDQARQAAGTLTVKHLAQALPQEECDGEDCDDSAGVL